MMFIGKAIILFQLDRFQFKYCKISTNCGLTKVNIKSKIGLFDHLPPSTIFFQRAEELEEDGMIPGSVNLPHSDIPSALAIPRFRFFITSTILTPRISD